MICRVLKKIGVLSICVLYYLIGNLFSVFLYDRRYIKGKYFESKYGGIVAIGWKWIVHDAIGRILLGSNRGIPWPVSPKITVTNPENIIFDVDDMHIFHTYGTYFQAIDAKIVIGKNCYIAPNVGIITANHNFRNLEEHMKGKDIIIGRDCWIAMNSMILPGTVLAERTIVAAGSVVTKSFLEGNCIIGGNPAKVLKYIEENE